MAINSSLLNAVYYPLMGVNIQNERIGLNAPITFHGCITAVSYTHLRAHETVLDLVCRLLLVKKKKNKIVHIKKQKTKQITTNQHDGHARAEY